MKINQIYVNLPVKDIQETKKFWTNLGFSVNEQISDERAVCIMMNDTIAIMFLTEEFFKTFSERPVPKGDTNQVLVAIGLDSREEVDQVVNVAVANGATQHEEPQIMDGCTRIPFGISTATAGTSSLQILPRFHPNYKSSKRKLWTRQHQKNWTLLFLHSAVTARIS